MKSINCTKLMIIITSWKPALSPHIWTKGKANTESCERPDWNTCTKPTDCKG